MDADGANRSREGQRRWKKRFLDALEKHGTVRAACRAASVSRVCAYRHKDKDEKFRNAWERRTNDFLDALEEEAARRAVGWEDKIFDKDGTEVGTRYQGSDRLMEFMLKAGRPKKFRESAVELNVGASVSELAKAIRDAGRVANSTVPGPPETAS